MAKSTNRIITARMNREKRMTRIGLDCSAGWKFGHCGGAFASEKEFLSAFDKMLLEDEVFGLKLVEGIRGITCETNDVELISLADCR